MEKEGRRKKKEVNHQDASKDAIWRRLTEIELVGKVLTVDLSYGESNNDIPCEVDAKKDDEHDQKGEEGGQSSRPSGCIKIAAPERPEQVIRR